MVLIPIRLVAPGDQREIFDAEMLDALGPRIRLHRPSAKSSFERHRKRGVELDGLAKHLGDNPMPLDVARTGPPLNAECVSLQRLNPRLRGWPRHHDGIAGAERMCRTHLHLGGSERNRHLTNGHAWLGKAGTSFAFDHNERTAIASRRANHGAAVAGSRPAQHHPAGR